MKINTFHKTYKKITPANSFMTENSVFRKQFDRVMLPYVVCADGFVMSVQASGTHYCDPKANVCIICIANLQVSQKALTKLKKETPPVKE